MARSSVGLDIGTSAVRAAQVASGRGGVQLTGFGQVALPTGAVVDGEIRDPDAVSGAIAQLWKRAKLRAKSAVVGVANQRVVVRQVDLPYLEEAEFRASLRFQVADHIPMPVDTAELDFQVLGEYTTEGGDRMMRVLLVAAATDMIETFVGAVGTGGIEPLAIDLAPFAIARAVSGAARGELGLAGAEAVIDVGAGITNIVVHHNGEPRFVRILLVGGNEATEAISSELDVGFEQAEALKLDLSTGVGTPAVQRVLSARVDTLVEEIRGSLDYYLSQEDSEQVISIILTGGASMTPGLLQRLEQVMRQPIQLGAPLTQMDVSKSGLTQEQLIAIQPVSGVAIGLAMGASAK